MNSLLKLFPTPGRQFAALAAALTALRILSLMVGRPELGPDEGQYWFWSRTPDFGYFSKPPLIAWSIGATTSIFGDAEWAVRLSAPLYQLGAAIFLFLLTRRIAGPREALVAGLVWLTLPGVFLSASLATTDAPLVFFWSAALYFYFILTDARAPAGKARAAALLGAAIGFGFLSKYAMAYFVIGAALSLAIAPARRRAAGAANLALAALVSLAVFAPNLWWNAQNDFKTVAHTAANADWGGNFGHPEQLLKFLGEQFAIAGPILLALMLLAAFFGRRAASGDRREAMRALIAFSIPAIAIITVQSFISRAHGNWAAVAYPSAVILATLYCFSDKRALIAMKASLVLHSIVGLGFLAAFTSAAFADGVGASAAFKRLRGWEEQGEKIAALSKPYDAIMTDDREVTGELVYYARGGKKIVAWDPNNRIDNHFEAYIPFDPARDHRVLYVTERADALYIQHGFRTIVPLSEVSARTGKGRTRTLYLFEVSGFIDR